MAEHLTPHQAEHMPPPPPPEAPSGSADSLWKKLSKKLNDFLTSAKDTHGESDGELFLDPGGDPAIAESELAIANLPHEAPSEAPTLPEHAASAIEHEVTATFAALDHATEDAKNDPEASEQLQALAHEVKAVTAATLRKVSEQLGSNRGGWYEDTETKDRWYVKFYKNPDQARVEYIANAVYEKLGIRSVHSELLDMDGQLAIRSREVPSPSAASGAAQRASAEVRSGFVADAYLANWDVVGLVNDNIVRSGDGHFYRIDNGGSLTFRAQGGPKNYAADAVPELETMLNPSYSAGKVFAGLTEEDFRTQATHLVRSLRPTDIETIVQQSGIAGTQADAIRTGLLGRRRALMERFGITEEEQEEPKEKEPTHVTPNQRTTIAAEKLREQAERLKSVELAPRVAFLGDSDKIANQQIDVIEYEDRWVVAFKLTEGQYDVIRQRLREQQSTPNQPQEGNIVYGKKDVNEFTLTQAWKIPVGDMHILVARAKRDQWNKDDGVRSALGLVHVEVPKKEGVRFEDLGEHIQTALREHLDVQDALLPPPPEAEKNYKWSRYAWHHKLNAADRPADWDAIEQRLQRKEVAPGHLTMVDDGRHREYLAESPYVVYHDIQHPNIVAKIIAAGGLICTHERYRRGFILDGKSSREDLECGGGDSVFTRIATQAGIDKHKSTYGGDVPRPVSSVTIIFKPSLLDRTDWYAYNDDKYGTTEPNAFATRQSPADLFKHQRKHGWLRGNEQMFREGIGVEHMRAIACRPSGWQDEARQLFARAKITAIGGESVDALLQRGARAAQEACAAAGMDRIGGESLSTILNREYEAAFVREFDRVISKTDWEAMHRVDASLTVNDFFNKGREAITAILRDVGIEKLGERTIEDLYDHDGCQLHDLLKQSGIDRINDQYVDDFVHQAERAVVLKEIRALGITTLGGTTIDAVYGHINETTYERIENSMGWDIMPSNEAVNQARQRHDPFALADALRAAGIDQVGGKNAKLVLAGDDRDRILEQLHDAGITTVNGHPVESFIVYGNTLADLINLPPPLPPMEPPPLPPPLPSMKPPPLPPSM